MKCIKLNCSAGIGSLLGCDVSFQRLLHSMQHAVKQAGNDKDDAMIKIKTVVSFLWHTWQNKNNNCFEFKNLWDTSTPKLEILLVQWLCTSSTLCYAFSYYYLAIRGICLHKPRVHVVPYSTLNTILHYIGSTLVVVGRVCTLVLLI